MAGIFMTLLSCRDDVQKLQNHLWTNSFLSFFKYFTSLLTAVEAFRRYRASEWTADLSMLLIWLCKARKDTGDSMASLLLAQSLTTFSPVLSIFSVS